MAGFIATAHIVVDNSAQVAAEIERALGNVVEGYAGIVAQEAQSVAPVRTGTLRANIGAQETSDPLVWAVVADIYYALYVELGTSRAGAQPYLLPALISVRAAFLNACQQAINAIP